MAKIHRATLVVSGIAHGASAAILWSTFRGFEPYRGFHMIGSILLVLSLIASVWATFTEHRGVFRAAELLRLVFWLGIVSGFRSSNVLLLLLLASMMFEVGMYLDYPDNAVFGAILLTVAVCAHVVISVRESAGVEIWLRDMALSGLIPGFLVYLSSNYSRFREQSFHLAEQIGDAEDAVIEVAEAHSEYLRLAMETEERSKLDERKRITRELHDSLGYNLTNVMMMLEAAKDLGGNISPQLAELLDSAQTQVKLSLQETRELLYILRGQQSRKPLGMSSVRRMAEVFERATRVHVTIDFANVPVSLGPDMDLALYHFVQEGLTNAFLHGKARRVWVTFWKDDSLLRAIVRDDGRGATHIEEGIGMRGMRERIGQLGGTFEATSGRQGFEIVASFAFEE